MVSNNLGNTGCDKGDVVLFKKKSYVPFNLPRPAIQSIGTIVGRLQRGCLIHPSNKHARSGITAPRIERLILGFNQARLFRRISIELVSAMSERLAGSGIVESGVNANVLK